MPPTRSGCSASSAGRQHEVITGLAVVELGRRARATPGDDGGDEPGADGGLHDDEIEAYVATGEPLDKAGGYAVQGLGGRLVAGSTAASPT